MNEKSFLKLALFLLIFRVVSSIVFVQFPSVLATVYELSFRFSQKFYLFSKLSGHLIVEPLEYDFGAVQKDQFATGVFKLYNSGYAPLKILKAAAGCGCTVMEVTKTLLNPGEFAELKFSVDTKGRDGFFETGIELQTTDVNNPGIILKIIGFVGKGIKISPEGGYIGTFGPGQRHRGEIKILHGGYEEFKIISVKSKKGILIVDDVITQNKYLTEISAHVVTDVVKVKKDYEDTLLIKTNVREYPLIKSTYSWTVDPEITVSK